tara:strand:- start:138 stop:1112 length:975 start_codon:yes stop_codon:yes gene_type:complete
MIDSIKEIYYLLEEAISLSLSYFVNTEKRIHILYLVTSAILAYYVYKKTQIKTSFLKYLFPKKVWASKSAFVDYSLFCFNSLIKIIFIGPYIILGFYIAFYINELLLETFGFPNYSLGVTQTIILYTIALTIISDFATYIVHFLMHKVPFLWEFHKIHHSATSLNPITQYRIHPLELVVNNIRSIIVFGLVTGCFDYLSSHSIDKLLFLGANVFHFVFLLFGANLRHSHVKLKYPKYIEFIFISPFQHQIHHSNNPVHFNKNMGSKFAIWDWLFGTLVLSKNVKNLRFGIGLESSSYNNLYKSIITPLLNIYYKIKNKLSHKKG